MAGNDLNIAPEYSLALKLAPIPMFLNKRREENWGPRQLRPWSFPEGYSDVGVVSGSLLILFAIRIFLTSPLPPPVKDSVGCTASWGSHRGGAALSPPGTKAAFIPELDTAS